jgi:radical SAM superfamily enzyme YgiQ (UPF0313 family)
MEKYRAHNWHCFGDLQRQPYAAIYTTLGCPYHCTFCCIQAPFREGARVLGLGENVNSYRMWSTDSVMAQITTLAFGIEAADQVVRSDVDKGYDQELIFKTINEVKAADISIGANYIFGLPEDDQISMQKTLDLALELNTEWANFYCTMAYPGSPLYDVAIKENMPLPATWAGYSQHAVDTLPLPTKHLKSSEVLRFRDNAFQTYFMGDRFLNMVIKKFGQETADHVKEMASHTLERQFA